MKNQYLYTFAGILLSSQSTFALAVECESNATNGKVKIEEITQKYQGIIQTQQDLVRKESQKIRDDTPNPSTVEAAVNMEIEFRENIREIILDIPTVTMKTQNMSMDLPQVTMKTQAWSWDFPEVTMKMECHGGIDEVVVETHICHNDFPPFDYDCHDLRTRRGPDICYNAPSVTMVRKEIKLDVPEVTMGRSEWSMDVPEIKMERQTIKINIPDIVVKDVKKEISISTEKSKELAKRANDSTSNIEKAMKEEIATTSASIITNSFSCQKVELKNKVRESYDKINNIEQTILVSYNKAKELNATDMVKSFESAMKSLEVAKIKVLSEYKSARKAMAEKEKFEIEKIKSPEKAL